MGLMRICRCLSVPIADSRMNFWSGGVADRAARMDIYRYLGAYH